MITVPRHQPIILYKQTKKEKKTKTILIGLYLFSRPYNRLQNFIIGVVIGRLNARSLSLVQEPVKLTDDVKKKKTNKRGKRPLIITPPRMKQQKNTTGSYTELRPCTSVVPSLRIFYCTRMENVWLSEKFITVHAIGHINTALYGTE